MRLKTVLQDLKSRNLSLNEAIDAAQNRPLCGDCLLMLASRTLSGAHQCKHKKVCVGGGSFHLLEGRIRVR